MAMKVLADIREREWDLYSRQLDAERTQQLIEADRQREAEYAKKLARDVAEMQAALSEKDVALSEKDVAFSEKDAALSNQDAALSETKAALSEAEARAHASEATLAKLLADLGRG